MIENTTSSTEEVPRPQRQRTEMAERTHEPEMVIQAGVRSEIQPVAALPGTEAAFMMATSAVPPGW